MLNYQITTSAGRSSLPASKRKEIITKDTRLDNPEIIVKDERIVRLDEIIQEVKQSEEWEAVRMSLIEIYEARGLARGEEKKLIQIICKQLAKGGTAESIAELLE